MSEEGLASPEALAMLRQRCRECDKIAVYQNVAMDSSDFGSYIFLVVGPTRTYQADSPPVQAPDGPYGTGWRYHFRGFLGLTTNQLEKT